MCLLESSPITLFIMEEISFFRVKASINNLWSVSIHRWQFTLSDRQLTLLKSCKSCHPRAVIQGHPLAFEMASSFDVDTDPKKRRQPLGQDPCASRTAEVLLSISAERAPLDVLWNYIQLVNSGPASHFRSLTNTTRCFPGSISYCATIKIITIYFYCHLTWWQAYTTLWSLKEWYQCLPWPIPWNISRPNYRHVQAIPHYLSSPTGKVLPCPAFSWSVPRLWSLAFYLLCLCIPKLRQSDFLKPKFNKFQTA